MYGLVSFEHSPAVSQNGTAPPGGPIFPLSNSFRINSLHSFQDTPPHVSPLESFTCRKQGWVGVHASCICDLCIPAFLVGTDGLYREGESLTISVFYHLRTTQQTASKTPLCFLSLTDL